MDFASLHPKQQEAVNACLDKSARRIVPITGEAGTGKTSIMRIVHGALIDAGFTVSTFAPTGKAAKRIKEAAGIKDAMTAHRGLEFTHPGDPDPKTGKPTGISVPRRYNPDHPLECDVLQVDEYAMINNEIHRSILDALPDGSRVIMYGDINQLEPIEADKRLASQPSPFQKMLNEFAGIKLEHNFRQEAGSGIATNCHRILRGWMPVQKDDFAFTIAEKPVDTILKLIKDKQEEGIDFTSIEHQIISPGRKSWVGTKQLNATIQANIWSDMQVSIKLPRHEWDKDDIVRIRVGDKVVCNKNLYEIKADNNEEGLFNGEVGIVTEIDEFEGFYVNVGDRVVYIPRTIPKVNAAGQQYLVDPRKDIDLAYVLTTHKCQGSEYGHVVYVMNKSVGYNLNRKNFYTACSRARKHVTVLTDKTSASLALYRLDGNWTSKKK